MERCYVFVSGWLLRNKTLEEVICHLKSISASHCIPQQLFSDNSPQLFREIYQFEISSGEVEWVVRTVKNLLSKYECFNIALRAYRSTPIQSSYSRSSILVMNIQLHSLVPSAPLQLKPAIPDYFALKEKEKKRQDWQRSNYNNHYRARELSPLFPGDHVWITDQQVEGTVVRFFTPLSFQVATDSGTVRQNHRHLNPLPETSVIDTSTIPQWRL